MSRTDILIACMFVASAACSGDGTQSPGCIAIGPPVVIDSSAVTENVRGGREYSCVLHAGDAPVRVTLVADTAANVISQIELRSGRESAPLQTLAAGETEPPYRGAEYFAARDMDGDGHLDLMLLSLWGATGNRSYHVWRWSIAANRFELDSTLSAATSPNPVAGRPCVTTRSNGGHAGMLYEAATLCLERGKWIETSTETQEELAGVRGGYVRVVRDRRGDTLAVTRVDTVRDSIPR